MSLATARSRAYNLLSAALGYPDQALWDALADGSFAAALGDAMAEATGESSATLTLPDGTLETLQASYVAAFDLGFGGNARSLNEADHRAAELRPDLLVELKAFYRCFGLGIEGCTNGVDHLAVELEFMHYLAYHEPPDEDAARPYREAQRDFLARHLVDWVPVLAAIHDGRSFYGAILAIAARLVAADAASRLHQ